MERLVSSFCRLPVLLFGATWMLLGGAGACRHDPGGLYALALDRPPTEEDWAGAVALPVEARGGQMSQRSDSDVDSDAVHTATASCHHGTGAPAITLDVRAFYTTDRIYLRFEWKDPTMDVGPSWRWNGARWASGRRGGADGLAILWGAESSSFSCAQVCHMRDWRMAGPRGLADFAMRGPPDKPALDLWIWRAGRGRMPQGMAEDAKLGPEGIQGDGPGDLFAPNSARALSRAPNPFDDGDTPLQAPDPGPDAWAPGYIALPAARGRVEVEGEASWRGGVWRLTLSRPIRGSDPGDELFAAGDEKLFGLSVFDGVAKDHNAAAAPIRLVLVERRALVAVRE